MDEIINNVKEVIAGYIIRNKKIQILCYANDAVIFAENKDDV